MSERAPTPADFIAHLAQVTSAIGAAELGPQLEERLNRDFPADGAWFKNAVEWCLRGSAEGWLCSREADGIKFGRAAPANHLTQGMSIDVVEMCDVAGPHHGHPNGEIDLIMPMNAGAEFDGRGAGWKVYPPGSAHRPTVSGGRALILYLLPDCAIAFTRT